MSVVKGCIIAAIALAAGAWVETARADEAYVCDAGRVVYVKPGELEIKKLQDPCIAKYFDAVTTARPSSDASPRSAASTAMAIADEPASRAPTAGPKSVPAQPSDFRNVRIINAGPGTEPWFKHRH